MLERRCLAALLTVLVACGPKGPMDVGTRADYTDEASTLMSAYEGNAPKIEIEKRGDRWFVTVYEGWTQSTGYAIRVERAVLVGTGLRIRARFTVPAPGSPVQGVSTSAAHTIGMPFGPDAIYLYDQDDRERAELVRR